MRKNSIQKRSGFTLIEGIVLLLVIVMCSYITFAGGNNIQAYLSQKNNLQVLEKLFSSTRINSIQNEETHTIVIDTETNQIFLDNQDISIKDIDFYKSSFGSERIVIHSLVSGAFSKAGSIYFSIYGKHYVLVIPIGFSEVYIK